MQCPAQRRRAGSLTISIQTRICSCLCAFDAQLQGVVPMLTAEAHRQAEQATEVGLSRIAAQKDPATSRVFFQNGLAMPEAPTTRTWNNGDRVMLRYDDESHGT